MAGLNGGDPTAAGRIRDAALVAFAREGDRAATEAIAAAAGVSARTLDHHFPTRASLREAVNEHVIAVAEAAFRDFDPDGPGCDIFGDMAERVTMIMREHPDALLYVARATIDGHPDGLGIFDAFMAIAMTRFETLAADGRLDPGLDVEWAALHVVIFNLSTVLFERAIDNHLPEGLRSPEGVARWHAADTELFRRGFLRTQRAGGD